MSVSQAPLENGFATPDCAITDSALDFENFSFFITKMVLFMNSLHAFIVKFNAELARLLPIARLTPKGTTGSNTKA